MSASRNRRRKEKRRRHARLPAARAHRSKEDPFELATLIQEKLRFFRASVGGLLGVGGLMSGTLRGGRWNTGSATTVQLIAYWLGWTVFAIVALNCAMRFASGDWRWAGKPMGLYLVMTGFLCELAWESRLGGARDWLLFAGYAFTAMAFPFLDVVIRLKVFQGTGTTGTLRTARFAAFGIPLRVIATVARNTELGKVALSLLKDPGPKLLSPLKALLASAIAYLAIAHGSLAAGEAIIRAAHPAKAKPHKIHTERPSPPAPVPPAPPPAPPPPPPSKEETWEDVCPHLPGYDAPPWARPLFMALYLGGDPHLHLGPAPGAYEGGCTGPTFVPERGGGTFAYELAHDPLTGNLMSVAVVSRKFGPAIYYAPAARAVLGLIHKGEIVGGPPRKQAAQGDLYLIESTHDTYALVRRHTTRADGSGLAARYVELLPAAVRAWRDAMRARRAWLWPAAQRRTTTTDTYSLYSSTGHSPVENIIYYRGTDVAYREVAGEVVQVDYTDVDPGKILALADEAG